MENVLPFEKLTMLPLLSPPESESRVPWTPRDIIWGLLAWLLLLVSLRLFKVLPLTIDVSLIIIFGEATLLLPTWYFTIYKYRANWGDLGLRTFNPLIMGLGCGFMILFFLFYVAYASILALFNLQTQPGLNLVFTKTAFPLALFFGGAVVAPFAEELFFRGFIFMGLRAKWGWKWATISSAGLFALVHLVPTSYLPIFFLGVILALLTQISDSIWPAIFIHMLNNGLALGVTYAQSTIGH